MHARTPTPDILFQVVQPTEKKNFFLCLSMRNNWLRQTNNTNIRKKVAKKKRKKRRIYKHKGNYSNSMSYFENKKNRIFH